jgi:hypothetical protein
MFDENDTSKSAICSNLHGIRREFPLKAVPPGQLPKSHIGALINS